jgi:hypothetical protein
MKLIFDSNLFVSVYLTQKMMSCLIQQRLYSIGIEVLHVSALIPSAIIGISYLYIF